MIKEWQRGQTLTASKLNETVTAVNSILPQSPGVQDGIPRIHTQVFIKITEAEPVTEPETFQWNYKCTVLNQIGIKGYTTDEHEVWSARAANIEAFNVFEDSQKSHFPVPVNTICRGNIYYAENRMYVWFWYQNTMSPFMCKVRKVSGVAGSDSTNCTWAYDVYDVHDAPDESVVEPMATAKQPYKTRFTNTSYTFAPPDSLAIACRNKLGEFILLECFQEVPDQDAC